MSNAQICTDALERYFHIGNELGQGYENSTYTHRKQPNTIVRNLVVNGYPQSEDMDAVTVYISTSTAPDIYNKFQRAYEMHRGYVVVDDLNFSSGAYLGIIECKVLAGSDTPSKASIFDKLENTAELSSYLLNIYDLELAKRHRAASKVIFRYIETHFAMSDLMAVDAMLGAIDLEKLSPWSISGLVRFTGRARSHLPCWSTVFSNAKTLLAKQGYKAEKLLAGIGE